MNKTIHELTELTEVAESDELIVYDVSDATSKKITKQNLLKGKLGFPDYARGNLFSGTASTYTATEDCWIEAIIVSNSTSVIYSIDNVQVSIADNISGVYVSHFSGFLQEGQTITANSSNVFAPARFKVFGLI